MVKTAAILIYKPWKLKKTQLFFLHTIYFHCVASLCCLWPLWILKNPPWVRAFSPRHLNLPPPLAITGTVLSEIKHTLMAPPADFSPAEMHPAASRMRSHRLWRVRGPFEGPFAPFRCVEHHSWSSAFGYSSQRKQLTRERLPNARVSGGSCRGLKTGGSVCCGGGGALWQQHRDAFMFQVEVFQGRTESQRWLWGLSSSQEEAG